MKLPNPSTLCLLLVGILASCVTRSEAETLVSNLGELYGGGEAQPMETVWYAGSFTTDSQKYNLTSIGLKLYVHGVARPVTPRIFGDESGAPSGTLLEVFSTQSVFGSTRSTYTFLSSGLTLEPNTTYWIALQGDDASLSTWSGTDSLAHTGNGTIGRVLSRSAFAGSAWTTTFNNSFSLQFSVDVVPVPEPSPALLGGLVSLAGVVLLRKPGLRRR